jgi:hypothetical protein
MCAARNYSPESGGLVLDMQPQRAPGIGADHSDVHAFVIDAVPAPGNAAQFRSQPAAKRIVVVIRQIGVEVLVEHVYFSDAHRAPAVGAGLENRFFSIFVVFVLYVADDLFQYIFHGNQASDAAMFIDDDGQVVAADAEFVQQHVQALGFGDEYCGPHQGAQRDRWVADRQQQVFGQEDAHDIVTVVFVDREARVAGFDDFGQDFGQWLADVQHVHLGAGHHDVGNGLLGHVERARDHGIGFAVEHLAFVRRFQNFLDVLPVGRLCGPHE